MSALMERFAEKAAEVEAMQFDGKNADEIVAAIQGDWKQGAMWLRQYPPDSYPEEEEVRFALVVPAPSGKRCEARPGDWICRNRAGEVYVVPGASFEQTYLKLEAR